MSILNTDQGAKFTSHDFSKALFDRGIAIITDGSGGALDNAFIERLWWTVKYEERYPKAYTKGQRLYVGLCKYFHWYNEERKHSVLDTRTPAEIFSTGTNQN